MSNTLRILNEFGIKPTNNCVSAGADFYVPYFDEDKWSIVVEAFKKSYGVTNIDIDNIISCINFYVGNHKEYKKFLNNKNLYNIVHLYLMLHSAVLESYKDDLPAKVECFVNRYLTFDVNKELPGIVIDLNDTVLVNSGIRVALFPGTAGIFFNKSGKGNAGFDVRACVVDEDYTGFVHLSLAYTKDTDNVGKRTIYCGDKLTQMVVVPVIHCDYEEIESDEYYSIMSNSERGNNALGSSDIKH